MSPPRLSRLWTFGLRQSGLWIPLSRLRSVRLTNGGSMYSTRLATMYYCPLAICLCGCQVVTSLNLGLWVRIALKPQLVITRIAYSYHLPLRISIRCSMSSCSNGIAVLSSLLQILLRSKDWTSMRWPRFLGTVLLVVATGWSSLCHLWATIALRMSGCRRAT